MSTNFRAFGSVPLDSHLAQNRRKREIERRIVLMKGVSKTVL